MKGEVYDPEKLDETYREMLRTGLFENLRVTPTPIAGDEVRLDFTAAEAKAKEVGFTIGYGSYEGAVAGIRLGDRNLFGRGPARCTFSAQYTQRGHQRRIPLCRSVALRHALRAPRAAVLPDAPEELGYSKNDIGFRADLSRKLLPHLELGAFVEAQNVARSPNPPSPSRNSAPPSYTLQSVGLTQTTDYRNDPINPARGFILTSAIDFATLDSQPAFTRATLRLSYYLPLGNCLLALGARGGYIAPLIDDLPIDVRFFNGGGTTVRSFAERELGPQDATGNPLGGDFLTRSSTPN